MDPGSGIRNRFLPDPESRILDPNHIYESLMKIFLQIGQKIFLHLFKNKISFNFVIFVATKKGRTVHFFLFLLLDPDSGMYKHPGSATLTLWIAFLDVFDFLKFIPLQDLCREGGTAALRPS
jgi:hypothetical protein